MADTSISVQNETASVVPNTTSVVGAVPYRTEVKCVMYKGVEVNLQFFNLI